MRVKFYCAAWPGLVSMEEGFLKMLKNQYGAERVENNADIIFYENRDVTSEPALCKVFITGENTIPENHLQFDLIIGFKQKSINSYRLPFWTFSVNWDDDVNNDWDVAKLLQKRDNLAIENRRRFCGFISVHARSYRVQFVQQLSRYKNVTCAGKVLNNFGPIGATRNDKKLFLQTCKFAIAFENEGGGDLQGYVTEKIIDAFVAGAIPIYWGDPTVSKVFNTKAFMNRHDYTSDELFIQAIIDVDSNDDAYSAMRREPIFVNNTIPQEFYPKNVCEKLIAVVNAKPKVVFYYGSAQKRVDVTTLATQMFIDQTTILIPATTSFNDLFGDVCPNVYKQLIIENYYNGTTLIIPEERKGIVKHFI